MGTSWEGISNVYLVEGESLTLVGGVVETAVHQDNFSSTGWTGNKIRIGMKDFVERATYLKWMSGLIQPGE